MNFISSEKRKTISIKCFLLVSLTDINHICYYAGKVVNAKIGGGPKVNWYMRDDHYPEAEETQGLEEKVLRIHPDPIRTAHLALVGTGNHKRYIIAHQNMKEGDIIKTNRDIPTISGNYNIVLQTTFGLYWICLTLKILCFEILGKELVNLKNKC